MKNLFVEAWPVWGMVIAIMAVVYLLWPSRLMKKNEYMTFFLSSIGVYWFVMLVAHFCLGGFHRETDLTGGVFLLCLIPWLTVTHLLFPFRHTRRNPQFTFLSVAFTGISLLLMAVAWILVQFSGM